MTAVVALDDRGGAEGFARREARAAEPIHQSVAIRNRMVDPTQNVIRVAQGDVLDLDFSVDEPVELHLHGYDKLVSVEPGRPALLRIEATIAGRFPLESHTFGKAAGHKRMHQVILYLEVHPR